MSNSGNTPHHTAAALLAIPQESAAAITCIRKILRASLATLLTSGDSSSRTVVLVLVAWYLLRDSATVLQRFTTFEPRTKGGVPQRAAACVVERRA